MRVLDIIKEAALDALTTAGLESVGPTSGTEAQIRELQTALRRHTLVTGLNADGTFRLGGAAWTAPATGEWSQALSDAVVAWHRSVDFQRFGTVRGTPSNTITYEDLPFLLYSQLNPQGLLVIDRNETDPVQNGRPNISQAGAGETYNRGPIPHSDPSTITTGRQFMDAIGFTGWIDIKTELLRLAEGTDEEIDISPSERRRELARFWQQVNDNLQQFPRTWVTHWRTEILASQRREMATLDDGSQIALNPPEEVTQSWSTLYEYFYRLASGLHTKFSREGRERAAAAQQVQANPDTATLNDSELSIKATQLAQAFENDWVAILPGGRDVDNDRETIESIFRSLNSAEDYNQLSVIYARQENESLEERLVSELDDDNYRRIVRGNLTRIRRIAPLVYHAAIQWSDTDQNMSVEHEGVSYTIDKETTNGTVTVKRGSTVVKDAILEDAILKEAVIVSGGTAPDLNAEVTNESIEYASAAFVTAIEESYPEMVAWYAFQEPFSSRPNTPDIGGLRLRGIVVEGGRLHAAGMNDADLIRWIIDEIENDHTWLIGTEDNPGAANIYFDRRYEAEGFGRNRNLPTGGLDTEITLDEQEANILSRLRSNNDAEINAAITDLFTLDDPAQSYERIYGKFTDTTGRALDKQLSDNNTFERILNGERDSSPLSSIIEGGISVPIAAPTLMAEGFAKAMTGFMGFSWTGTDEDLMDKLVNLITSRSDYALVNYRYQQISESSESLLDDIAGEELFNTWYNRLSNIIGEEAATISNERLPEDVRRALISVVEEPSAENLRLLNRRLNTSTVRNMDYSAYRTVVLNLQNLGQAVEAGDVELDDEAMGYVEEILNRLVPMANEKYEGTWGDFFNPNWFRWVTFQGSTPGWFND